jgi:hypothetical protein
MEIGPILQSLGVTGEDIAEVALRTGVYENFRIEQLVLAVALLKIEKLEKKLAELETK